MRDIEYGITYMYLNGAHRQELGFLERDETEPDITRLPIDKNVWAVQIGFAQPLEHELVLRKGAEINPKNERWPFCAMYFPDADRVTYEQMREGIKFSPMKYAEKAMSLLIAEIKRYGVQYADYKADKNGKALLKSQEMFFIRTKADAYAALSENSAILTPIRENGQGALWIKKSPFLLRNGLA